MWTERENDEDPDRISKLSKPAHEKFCACRECTTALLNSCPPGNARPRMVEMFRSENDEDPDRISKLSKPAHEKFCACRECTTALLNSCPPGNARPRMVEMF